MNHIMNPPYTKQTVGFKLKTSTYELSHSYGHYRLVRVIDGKPHDKAELTNQSTEAIWRYLSQAERCTHTQAKEAYEQAKKIMEQTH